jgi:hypothetical protein
MRTEFPSVSINRFREESETFCYQNVVVNPGELS